MAIVTTKANAITGSATNTLGTLGRSVFNSTVGTFADQKTMDELYKVADKLNASIETVDKKIDYEALNGRNKADSLYSVLVGMDIKSSSDFMNKNREFMKRLMRLNKQEKDITLNALGVDVTGDSNTVTNEHVRHYKHVGDNDYYEGYAKTIRQNQLIGDETTSMQLESSNHFNYSGLHNDLYSVTQNLYPDDENSGTFANKWIVENRNSLLYKTKKLFNSKKVKTIISRFHTDPNTIPSPLDNAKSKYGLSHGRNLLTKEAEKGYNSSYRSGYDDPYCRVWTHHHQYDRYYKTIRPFSTVDSQGNYEGRLSVEDFHQWSQFSDDKDSTTRNQWGWKKESNTGWQNTVLQDNGMVNITPKYKSGGATNIHTKQCMFSIENLAWRGYDPYSFEQALSWEQRGPLGGRIMWFPPYGIKFNETTTTQWNTNTFLGRGEDVYTYTNTTRTGTLSFMLVVDHPSILDYVSWSNENRHQVSDTDILRFLAGCGEGDGAGGLRSLAKPTPLTDEYTQEHDHVKQPETKTTPEEEKSVEKQICFYVFYPNNYSGTYDNKWSEVSFDGRRFDATSKVEAIPYLITGKGAQKSNGAIGEAFGYDIELNEDTTDATHMGNGYEMGRGGLGKEATNYISGTSRFQNQMGKEGRRYWTGLGKKGQPRSQKYTTGLKKPKNCKKWYYRIDGRYVLPKSTDEEKYNYYNQTLLTEDSYVDGTDFGLNHDINVVYENFKDQLEEDEENKGFFKLKGESESSVFTLAEIAYVLYGGFGGKDGKSKVMAERCNIDGNNNSRIDKLKELLEIGLNNGNGSVNGEGYASAHGYVETNKMLGANRARTAVFWVKHLLNDYYGIGINGGAKAIEDGIGDKDVDDKSVKGQQWIKAAGNGEDKIHAKKWRYAKVIIKFSNAATTTVAKANNTGVTPTEIPVKTKKITFTYSGKINLLNDIKGEVKLTINENEDGSVNTSVIVNENVIIDGTTVGIPRSFNSSKTWPKFGVVKYIEPSNVEEVFLSHNIHSSDKVEIKSQNKIVDEDKTNTEDDKKNLANNKGGKTAIGFNPTNEKYTDKDGKEYPIFIDNDKKKWYLKDGEYISISYSNEEDKTPVARYGNGHTDENRLRYDQEYHFFKVLEQTDPVVYSSLMDKLQYFDPAFHSMTPEGFNGRLTFLQQCMRQGNTVSASDGKFSKNANNLAFGRAPYCVLRLGDFYNQMIVIDSLDIDYDPLVWDLNVEGAGVQPLIANVRIGFKFVGGSDMTGPVRRLQNAMSFNYYANARLYDNRADRIERNWSDKTNGAIQHDEILDKENKSDDFKKTYQNGKTVSQFYTTKMY